MLLIQYEAETLALIFDLAVTLRDEPWWLYSLSIIPQVSCCGFIEFKYRNTTTSFANSIRLVFPDVIYILYSIFICACVGVCECVHSLYSIPLKLELHHYVSA